MPRAAQARAWWADVEDVRERIERKRDRERANRSAVRAPAVRRGVREVRPGRHLTVVSSGLPAAGTPAVRPPSRSRPRRRALQRVGPRPDRVASWAVLLGFALVLAAVLSAHG